MRIIGGSTRRRLTRETARSRSLELTERIFQEMFPKVAGGQPEARLSRSECSRLMARIQEEVDSGQLKSARIYIRSRLEKIADKHGGDIYVPAREAYIRRDISPFSGNSFYLVKRLSRLRKAFEDDVSCGTSMSWSSHTESVSEQDLEVALGRVLFSAVVNGGLVIRPHLKRLLGEVFGGGLKGYRDCAWISFTDPGADYKNADQLDAPVRRWFLDPVTLGLIVRITQSPLREKITPSHFRRPYEYLARYLRILSRSSMEYPDEERLRWTSMLLIKASRANLSLFLAQPLVRFLSSNAEGQSMSERTWWRYRYDRILPRQDSEVEGDNSGVPLIVDTERVEYRFRGSKESFFKRQQELLRAFQRCLYVQGRGETSSSNAASIKAIKELVDTHREEMAPLLMAYCLWIRWKLSLPSTRTGRIRAVSARRYTSRLGQTLVALGVEMDISEANSDDWSGFYEDVLEHLSSDLERNKAAGNLKQFHDYLMMSFDCPPAYINGQSRELPSSRSTLVTEKDYQAVLAALNTNDEHKLRMLRCILMLAYRTGMRPKEIIGLEFRHIQGFAYYGRCEQISDVIISLRSTSKSTLKTPSAVRQLPLRWFLADSELDEVHNYLRSRLQSHKEGNYKSLAVFPKFPGEIEKVSQSAVYKLLGSLLRKTSSDELVVPYSLRHSFLSNLFFELMSPFGKKYAQLKRDGVTPYEAVYTISTLAGQLDPEISLRTYIHTQDYVSYLNICEKMHNRYPASFWAALEGIKTESISRRYKRGGMKAMTWSGIKEPRPWYDTTVRLMKEMEWKPPRSKRREAIELPETILEERRITDLDIKALHAMFCSMHRNHSTRARAEQFGVPESDVTSLSKWAKKLGEMKTSPYSGLESSRMLRRKPARKLPPVYQSAQPGMLAPAPPNHSRTEMAEANRIFSLIIRRTRNFSDDRAMIRQVIINPVHEILASFSRSEAAVRITSEDQLYSTVSTLRDLLIDQQKIELEIESLPNIEGVLVKAWEQELGKLSKSTRLRMHKNNHMVIARSEKYPDFGIVNLRVKESPVLRAGESISAARKRVGDRGGSGWRVGCFYALAAIGAYYWND